MRPRAGIKGGSRATSIPEGAAIGFTSASKLWDLRQVEEDAEAECRMREEEKAKAEAEEATTGNAKGSAKGKKEGKLARPRKKKQDPRNERIQSNAPENGKEGAGRGTEIFSLTDSVHDRWLGTETRQDQGEGMTVPFTESSRPTSRTPSFSLDEFALPETDEAVAAPIKAPVKTTKKPRKRGNNDDVSKVGEGETVAKRPGRQEIQPEEFILNSDDADTQSQAPGQSTDTMAPREKAPVERPLDKGRKPRRRKADEGPPAIEKRDAVLSPKKQSQPRKNTANGGKAQSEKSTYFLQPELSTEPTANVGNVAAEPSEPMPVEAINSMNASGIAAYRRRSWTPVRDSGVVLAHIAEADTDVADVNSVGAISPTTNLTALLGGYSYNGTDQSAKSRTVSGEAPSKRRRVGPAKVAEPIKAAEAPTPTIKVTKKAKAPKKPQTITALATAAYMPVAQADSVEEQQATVSEFFAPAKPPSPANKAPPQSDATAIAKPKNPRKSRAKPQAEGGTAKPKKSKKVKVKEADLIPPLLTPEKSRAHIGRQDFLFGTSSQLAGEESPSFVRDMQLAMRDSEVSATQLGTQARTSPQSKSCARVPTAPHGTSLSVGQAARELWCVSARDHEEGTLAAQERVSLPAQIGQYPHHFDLPGATQIPLPTVRAVEDVNETRKADTPRNEVEGQVDNETQDSGFVDITSPPAQHFPVVEDDDWMLLKSDESNLPPLELSAVSDEPRFTAIQPFPIPSRSPSQPVRTALQPLNSNIGVMTRTSPAKPTISNAHTVSTLAQDKAPATSPVKKKRGRPRKEEGEKAPAAPSPKRRGRPRKTPIPPTNVAGPGKSPAKMASTHASASQTEWHHIDEIDDSDSPATPSPPRRRATSTPPAIRPLDLAPPASPSHPPPPATKVPAPSNTTTANVLSATAILKPTDPQWPSIITNLFPQITNTIKTASRSSSLTSPPSWHEKILLYDPIVLEDLTEYLNTQQVRVKVERAVEAPKNKKGRKRKAVDEEAGQVEGVGLTEIREEDLKPWMVQKWCEEVGVCCLWREGLRGGVKARY